MLWVYLHFHQLYLDNAACQPEAVDHPVVVYQASQNRVLQCNPSAEKAGLRCDMGMAQAAALCPELTILDYHKEHEVLRLQALANRLYLLVADIVLFEPQGLAIRLDPLIRYYHGLENLWRTLTNELAGARVNYHFGFGWNIEAAQVLASVRHDQILTQRQQIKSALDNCPLSATQLTAKQQHSLARVGINSLSQLLTLQVTELGKRFENKLVSYLCTLRNDTLAHYQTYRPADKFQSVIEPTYEISQADQLMPWLQKLVSEFCDYARLRNRVTFSLRFTLSFREAASQSLIVSASAPLYQASQWFSLIGLKLETLLLTEPVILLSLSVDELEEITEQTNDFFNDRHHLFAQKQLLSRLQTRLGETAIRTPLSGQDYRQEKLSSTSTVVSDKHSAQPLPSFTLASPECLSEQVHIEHGPVRIHTGWWDAQPVKRDYFIARTPSQQRVQIYREGDNWFIHGWYS